MRGPVVVLKVRLSPPGYGGCLVDEPWLHSASSRIPELTPKCALVQALQAAAETKACPAAKGVDLAGEQDRESRTALEFFATALRGGERAVVGGDAAIELSDGTHGRLATVLRAVGSPLAAGGKD